MVMKFTVWGIWSIIMYQLCMVVDHDQTYHGDHFEIYRNIKSLWCVPGTNSVVGQLHFENKQTNKLIEKRSHLQLPEAGGYMKGELDGGSQKVQTSSYKINKSQGCNGQHDKYN